MEKLTFRGVGPGRDVFERGECDAATADLRGRAFNDALTGGPPLPVIRRSAATAIETAGGRLDGLVNNAATLLMPTPKADISVGLLRDAFAVNVFAPFLLTGIVAPEMARAGRGVVVNIGSITGLRESSGSAVYSANKAAIHSLTKSWADEYGPAGVRVNTVAPGRSRPNGRRSSPTISNRCSPGSRHAG